MHNSNFLNVSLILYKILFHSLAVSRFPSILQGFARSFQFRYASFVPADKARRSGDSCTTKSLFYPSRPAFKSQPTFHRFSFFFSSLHKRVALKRCALKAVHCATFEAPAWNQLG